MEKLNWNEENTAAAVAAYQDAIAASGVDAANSDETLSGIAATVGAKNANSIRRKLVISANIAFDDHPNDTAMRDHAYKQSIALYDAVGATRSFPTPPYPSTHNLGTNRMSEKARDGVVNKWGQTHDVKNLFISDGSQFTTGGAENPTLTIVSLAIRQADYIADQMKAKAI